MRIAATVEDLTNQLNRSMHLNIRLANGDVVKNLRPEDIGLYSPEMLVPWRAPASYKGQKHLPGHFWMSQTKQLIHYESRLEMAILKQLDFEENISFVLAQPFELHFQVGASKRRHVPDFLVWRKGTTNLLVNVKPKVFMDLPRNRESFSACHKLTRLIRLEHRVFGEPPPFFFANLRWLAGFRREPISLPDVGPLLTDRLKKGKLSFEEWIDGIGEEELTRPAAFHLLWTRQVTFDLSCVLENHTTVWLRA